MQATVQPLGTSFAPASKSPSVTLTTTPRETDSRQAGSTPTTIRHRPSPASRRVSLPRMTLHF